MSTFPDLWKRPRSRPLIVGILNLTPDSFSDGGKYLSKKDALEHAHFLIRSGADIIDIGGESTRPGSDAVTVEEELSRVIDVIEELASTTDVPLSIDTTKPVVAEASLNAGAVMINDISGLREEAMIRTAIEYDAAVVITHMHGTPKTFLFDTMRGDANGEIKRFLGDRAEYATGKGMKEGNIIIDPGIGFGKTAEQDMSIIENSGWFSDRYPILIAPSRKKFLSKYCPDMDKDQATAVVSGIAAENGAGLLRVHNVPLVLSYLENKKPEKINHSLGRSQLR
ncbi:dihydropteroate synthase [Candidatus Methanoplasma termitum]|uniref:dihydropteroate synthase n=1 Tax=Candidatus Methanoplasma termitum TaxID=1577791 RepID=A0A0A7L9W1_9ARCH|nr:dihydropteroate synthase [Candidatus Methanoplasma termitum]AIZ55940.1 dihydropteroate synthase [Candidatus Methanoplasma termitum]MCL2334258.1 dihydropteroate synthase [Candidatus Methanoplasma sp.]